MLLATHRGGPVVGVSSPLPVSTGVQPPVICDVGALAGVVSRGCTVGDGVPSLIFPCVAQTLPENDPVLVRYRVNVEQENAEREGRRRMMVKSLLYLLLQSLGHPILRLLDLLACVVPVTHISGIGIAHRHSDLFLI